MHCWMEWASDLAGHAASVLAVLAAVAMMVSLIPRIVFRYRVGEAWST